jgi:predicted nuclease of predicted toxin-antitoxin system
MKFVVDAQLPLRLARQLLVAAGQEAVHTSDLVRGNRTSDTELAAFADEEGRVLVTKDRDFRDSHLLRRSPQRLLVVATGNITNSDLLSLFDANLVSIIEALNEASFVEMGQTGLIVHRDHE